MAVELAKEIGKALSHLSDTPTAGREIEIEPLLAIGLTIAQRDAAGGNASDDLSRLTQADQYSTVIQPLLNVCGPL